MFGEENMKAIEAKVILVGNEGVGKTSLVLKFIDRNFNRTIRPTIGASFFKCKINLDDTLINMQIWDTAGQERFRSLVPMYYRNTNAALIVFDITEHYTFTVAKMLINELLVKAGGPVVLTLVGNKKDLAKQRKVSQEEALEFSKKVGALYCECTAQEFQGVQEIFLKTARELLKLFESKGIASNEKEPHLIEQNLNYKVKRSNCCKS